MRTSKEGVSFLFIDLPVLSLHSPLLPVQHLSVKEIAEAEFWRGGSQMPEDRKSDNLLRIMERNCDCCFSVKSPSMPIFPL